MSKLDIQIANGPLSGQTVSVDVGLAVPSASQQFTNAISSGVPALQGLVTVVAAQGADPQGWIKLAEALSTGVMQLVNRIRSANTTSIVIVNAIPDSTISMNSLSLKKGSLLDGLNENSINLQARATDAKPHALIMGIEGRSEGKLSGTIYGSGGSAEGSLSINFENPLGPRQSRSSYSHSASSHKVDFFLSIAEDKTRQDVAVFIVSRK